MQKEIINYIKGNNVLPSIVSVNKYNVYIDKINDISLFGYTDDEKEKYLSKFDFYGAIGINKDNMHEIFHKQYKYISFDLFGENVVMPFECEMIPRINYMHVFDTFMADNEFSVSDINPMNKMFSYRKGKDALICFLQDKDSDIYITVFKPQMIMIKNGVYFHLQNNQVMCILNQLKDNEQIRKFYKYYEMLFTDIDKMSVEQGIMFKEVLGEDYVQSCITPIIKTKNVCIKLRTPVGYYFNYHKNGDSNFAMFKIVSDDDFDYNANVTIIDHVIHNFLYNVSDEKVHQKLCNASNNLRFTIDGDDVFFEDKNTIHVFSNTEFGLLNLTDYESEMADDIDIAYSTNARLQQEAKKKLNMLMKLSNKNLKELIEEQK
jgi:hypothetical protein